MKHLALNILLLLSTTLLLACNPSADTVTARDLDMTDIKNIEDKKKRFFDFMRPIIISENNEILKLRRRLLAAREKNNDLPFVLRTAKNYTVAWDMDAPNWEKLLERVDAVALELALAQSANETSWGQSRFARKGNNFFGQWCYQKGCGMIAKDRTDGAQHEIARFRSVNASVRSYLKNLNTGRAYTSLRMVRRTNREAGNPVDAIAQAGGLILYSQRRHEYVKEIRAIIRTNNELMQRI